MKTPALFLAGVLAIAMPCLRAQSPAPSRAPSREDMALIQRAMADFDSHKYDAALAKLTVLEKKLPDNAFVLNLVGTAHTKKKDYATAKKYFEGALAKQPDFFPAKFNVGELLFLQRQYAEALGHFEKMRRFDRPNELLQFKIVLCHLQLGRTAEAATELKAMKYPSDTPAWYYANAAWESKNGNNKKAREYLTGARYIFGPKTAIFEETFEDLGVKLR